MKYLLILLLVSTCRGSEFLSMEVDGTGGVIQGEIAIHWTNFTSELKPTDFHFTDYKLVIKQTGAETTEIVTNVVHSDNSGCSICNLGNGDSIIWDGQKLGSHFGPCDTDFPATEKTTTTTIILKRKLTFTWRGKEYAVKSDEVLSETVERLKLKKEWVKE